MSFAFGSPSTNTILAATDSGYVLVADTRTKRYLIVFLFMQVLIGRQESFGRESISQFYNKWAIPRPLVGWELFSIREQTMEMTWWWRNLSFSFSRARFQRIFNINVIKTVNVVVKNKSTTIFYGLFSDRPKLCSETTRPGPLVPLEFWTIWLHFYGR